MKGYDKFPFEERKRYEETFVQNNNALIQGLTGASLVYNISQTLFDVRAGVEQEGYSKECYAIMLQTNVFANYLKELINTNTLEDYYIPVLDAYEFEFTEVFTQTDTGVDLFHIQNNNIKYVKTHEESS